MSNGSAHDLKKMANRTLSRSGFDPIVDRYLSGMGDSEYDDFLSDIDFEGGTFGDAEVQRALAKGYTLEDVNNYLKDSGITPSGSFGVAGYNESYGFSGSGDGAGFSKQQTPYYRYFGPAVAAPPPPPDPTAYNPGSVTTYNPTAAVQDNFNPAALQIRTPESDPMIAQLQQNLITAAQPPDTSALNAQLMGIRDSVQQAPSALANIPSLGQGVSLDSFSSIYQNQVNNTPTQGPSLGINTDTTALTQAYGNQLGINQAIPQVSTAPGSMPRPFSISGGGTAIPNASQLENVSIQDPMAGLTAQFRRLTALQNQAGWRNKAAMQIGSKSADSIQSEASSGPSGTDKLNRNTGGTYFKNLMINRDRTNPLAIGGGM